MDMKQVLKVEAVGEGHYFLIPFTEYVLPNGRQKPNPYRCEDQEVADKAQAILDADFRFDIEVLRTGAVSATIGGKIQYEEGDDPEDGDVAMTVAFNGSSVPTKIDEMIRGFVIPEDGIVRRC